MSRSQLRVVSYNFKGLQMDTAALLRTLREAAPDVVAVQEPPRFVGARGRLRALAQDCGLEVVVYGNYPFGGATTALLATPEIAARVRAKGSRILPFDPWRWIPLWRSQAKKPWPSRRGFAFMDIGEYVIFAVHLGLNPAERMIHRNIVLNYIKRLGPDRAVVAGDLNERPDGESWRAFGRPLTDAVARVHATPNSKEFSTFPAKNPRLRIDAVFVGSAITPTDAYVVHGPTAVAASDHLPIVVQLG